MSRPTLDLRQLETLMAVLAHGSFHEAGRRLGLAQSTVSLHVRKLEETMGATLVERGMPGCRPTRAARTLIPFAESLLLVAARALDAGRERGLVVGASGNIGTFMLPEPLRRFETSGGSPVEVVIAPNPAIAERLGRAELDVALLEWWDNRPGFDAVVWREEPLVAIAAPGHTWAKLGSVTAGQLGREALLGGEPGTGTGRLLHAALGGAGRAGRQLGSTEAVKRAVRAGLGVSVVLAAAVADEAVSGTLAVLPIAGAPGLRKQIWAVHRSHAPPNAAARHFLRSIQEI